MSQLFPLGDRGGNARPVVSLNTPVPESGGLYIADTTLYPVTPAVPPSGWCAIYVVTTAVLNASSVHNIAGLNGVSLPAGTWVYGMFSQIKLTSGSIIAYNATPQS